MFVFASFIGVGVGVGVSQTPPMSTLWASLPFFRRRRSVFTANVGDSCVGFFSEGVCWIFFLAGLKSDQRINVYCPILLGESMLEEPSDPRCRP